MKKIIFLVAALCFSIPFYGQETPLEKKSNVVFGVKAGINALQTKIYESSKIGIGFQVGATLDIPISTKFSFQPELLFQVVNSKYDYNNVYSNGSILDEVQNKNAFLLVPLNFKYAISKKVGIELGPNIGYLVGPKQTIKTTYNFDGLISSSERSTTEYNGNKFTLGANLGVNYNISNQLYAGLRYTLFISQYQTADDTLNNSVFSLSMGYKFI